MINWHAFSTPLNTLGLDEEVFPFDAVLSLKRQQSFTDQIFAVVELRSMLFAGRERTSWNAPVMLWLASFRK